MNEGAELKANQFIDFFEALHGYCPFPWQRMLLEQCASGKWQDGWPDLIDLPTASGKTACIDVAVFLLAMQADVPKHERTAARRIWFVVDRRIVVDEAYERAKRIAQGLLGATGGILAVVANRLKQVSGTGLPPLAIARLRGGAPKELAWSYHPAQPAVITSTVDQVGSRLLFRGYGVGKHSRPIHAALAGNDSLIILDEAHTANAFRQTAGWCKRLRARNTEGLHPARTPFHLVMMSATPPTEDGGQEHAAFPEPQDREKALRDNLLDQRYNASKPAELVEVGKAREGSDPLVKEAAERAIALAGQHRRVAVMVNRVATATAIVEALRSHQPKLRSGEAAYDVVLLTGRMRPVDRDEMVEKWSKYLRANNPEFPTKPVILVTTQCLEVGADFSFGALATECASLDALRQRFGRVNRLGTNPGPAPAVILIRQDQHKEEAKLDDAKPLDPVYDNALARTWNWLATHAEVPAGASGRKKLLRRIDMGINAVAAKLESAQMDAPQLKPLLAPAPDAPILLPAYLDLLCQTGPAPDIEPDVALFLHGPDRGAAEVSVVFRQDLDPEDTTFWEQTIELMPPVAGEKLSVPIWRLKRFLAGELEEDPTSDVESERRDEVDPRESRSNRPNPVKFIVFGGKSDIVILDQAERIETGDTIVLPAPQQFPGRLGTPGEQGQVDVYEKAYRQAHGQKLQRVHERVPVLGLEDRQKEILDLARVSEEELDEAALTAALGMPSLERIQFLEYPDGKGRILIHPPDGQATETELDPFAFDEVELLDRHDGELLEHTRHVEKWVADLAKPCVSPDLLDLLMKAARFHDLGKADERFQRQLNNGRRFGAVQLLAKSRAPISMSRWKQLREVVGLPEHFRHEMLSMQLAAPALADEPQRDLILHLIASHHGYARPFAPCSMDESPPDIEVSLQQECYSITGASRRECQPHHLESGVSERFWQLTRQHGWWGLAYMEALLRLADRRASRDSEEGGPQ